MSKKNKFFLVIGMHRSATSLYATSLANNGVYMGSQLLAPAPDNPKGFGENTAILAFNERVLRKYKAEWNKPPTQEVLDKIAKDKELIHELDQIINEQYVRHNKPLNGLKEPRTTLLWQLYYPILDKYFELHVSFVTRPKEAIKASLKARVSGNNMSDNAIYDLIEQYVKQMLKFQQFLFDLEYDTNV